MLRDKPLEGRIALASKIGIPTYVSHAISREVLNAKLDRVRTSRLTSVVSSAGYGKTTCVASWAKKQTDVALAWLCLDDDDSQLNTFLFYFTSALRAVDEAICPCFEDLNSKDDFSSIKPFIEYLIQKISAYGANIVLVLEDFHVIHDNSAVIESVSYFIKRAPQNMHLVITSRRALPFPTSKMRVENTLNEITETELAFSLGQVAEFFRKAGYRLDNKTIKEIHSLTAGWPTGSRLISLLGFEDSKPFTTQTLSHAKRSIHEYLFEEVLQKLEPNLQEFLVYTSLVSTFNVELASFIVGCSTTDSAEHIDALVKNNLFIEEIRDKNGQAWYRYHQLLGNMLHLRLEHVSHEQLSAMLNRARAWYHDHGLIDNYVEFSARLCDYDAIKQLIIQEWQSAYMNDSCYALVRWSSHIPHAEILKSPALCVILTMPYSLCGKREQANAYITQAKSCLQDKTDFFYAFCLVQEAYLATFAGNAEQMRLLSDAALQFLPTEELYLRGMMQQVFATSYIKTDPLHAEKLFFQTLEQQNGIENKNLLCNLYCDIAILSGNLGHLHKAQHFATLALSLYDEESRLYPSLAYAYLAMMIYQYSLGAFDEVCNNYRKMTSLAVEGIVVERLAQAKTLYAKALEHSAPKEAAPAFFDAMYTDELGAISSFPSLSLVACYVKCFKTASTEHISHTSNLARLRLFKIALGYFLCADVRTEAYELARTLSEEDHYAKLYALILATVLAEQAHQFSFAESFLQEALNLARTYGLGDMIRDNALYIEPTLERLKHAFDTTSCDALNVSELQGETITVHLTPREHEIMELIAAGATVSQVAEKLFLSRDTIKKQLSGVYAKLDVHSKTQAIALLREKNLL